MCLEVPHEQACATWQCVVWDELQNLKDGKTNCFQHALMVKCERAIGLSGTS